MRCRYLPAAVLLVSLSVCTALAGTDHGKNLKNTHYPELGIVFAGFGAMAGYWFGPFGFQLSGSYFGRRMNGAQFAAAIRISDTTLRRHALGGAVGRSQDPGCDYSYIGPVYSYTRKHLFLEIGAGKTFNVKRGDFSDLPWWIIFQIGYVYRFLPRGTASPGTPKTRE